LETSWGCGVGPASCSPRLESASDVLQTAGGIGLQRCAEWKCVLLSRQSKELVHELLPLGIVGDRHWLAGKRNQ
jgi:hypothetical protein